MSKPITGRERVILTKANWEIYTRRNTVIFEKNNIKNLPGKVTQTYYRICRAMKKKEKATITMGTVALFSGITKDDLAPLVKKRINLLPII
ncbi:MAG: hypothetical protein O6939_09495 [Bacteroidetes bacterium]|nr:hypothetical protein [Bacteroidota bacterium]